jgi:hypothetical protein
MYATRMIREARAQAADDTDAERAHEHLIESLTGGDPRVKAALKRLLPPAPAPARGGRRG